MEFHDELKELGVNIEEALGRFMGNKPLFNKMVAKFPKAVEDNDVLSFFNLHDYESALKNAHTLKGVTGNLSFTPLYEGYSEVVRLLRADQPDEACKVYNDLVPVQNDIIRCIEKYSV